MMLRVRVIDDSVPTIRSLTLAADDGRRLPGFVPGSHVVIDAGGRSNAYSLTGDGIAPSEYRISVLRVDGGHGGSRWIHDMLGPGDTVTVSLPRSAFAPVARARRQVLIAGGIGVTPILSHLRSARRWNREVRVFYTHRPGVGAHLDEMTELAGGDLAVFTSREEFCAALDVELTRQPFGTHLYACGPAGMIDRVHAAASAAYWPASRVHVERFGIDTLDAGEPFRVHLRESQRTIDVPSGTSMLEALERNGIAIRNRCRQGVCGECVTPVSAGVPTHRDLYLSDEDKNSGAVIMPCVSRAACDTTLEVPR